MVVLVFWICEFLIQNLYSQGEVPTSLLGGHSRPTVDPSDTDLDPSGIEE
jgi:hypothetical protein